MNICTDDLPLFAPARPAFLKPGRLEDDFWNFHQANPAVYAELVKFAREWRRGTGKRLGIKALYERQRWESEITTTTYAPALNNNHTAFYARLIMERESDLRGLFQLREQHHAEQAA